MKKEVSIYLFVGLLAVGTFLAVYYLNLGLTGFAVFEQNTADAFNEGVYENVVYDGNLSAVVLSQNQTSGTYTSKVFDGGSSVNWNNLTFVGSENIDFEARACSSSNCSDASFSSVTLNNLNLTGQYFQYRAIFDASAANETLSLESVSIGSFIPVTTSVSVSEPTGEKSANTGISLNFSVAGEGLTCWYDVRDSSDDALITDNTTISGCTSLVFDLGAGEGSYTVNVYANGSSGFDFDSSDFTIDLPSSTTTEDEEETESAAATEIQIPVAPVAPVAPVVTAPATTELSAPDIGISTVIPGSLHEIKWTVRNTGTEPVSACLLKSQGDIASWASASGDAVNLNAEDSNEFVLTINVPAEAEDGSYSLSVSVECAETSATKEITLNVERKKLEFDIIDAQRTRADRVRVVYSLEELTGEIQDVEVHFSILDSANAEVANSSQNRTLDANSTEEFSVNIPVNESLEGNFSLSAKVNSEVYTTSVLEPITLGTPVGGFAIFGQGLGTGGFVVLIVVVLVLLVVFFVVRKMRKPGKS